MTSFHIWLFKKATLQNNVHMLSFHILTWASGTGHTSTHGLCILAPILGAGRGQTQGGPMSSVIIKIKSTLLPFGETKSIF